MYIGQSNDIERRFKEHCYKTDLIIEKAIHKYGKENFSFEILEECSINELNKKEIYYIALYDSIKNGYNLSTGGSIQVGELNSNAHLSEYDIIDIRTSYQNHERTKDVYERYKDKITYGSFMGIWEGTSWPHIMSEVYTKENKNFYRYQATNGELSPKAVFSNDEVIALRKRYVNETAQQIYKDIQDRCAYQTLQAILWGRSYKNLPLYKKKEKKWINL